MEYAQTQLQLVIYVNGKKVTIDKLSSDEEQWDLGQLVALFLESNLKDALQNSCKSLKKGN